MMCWTITHRSSTWTATTCEQHLTPYITYWLHTTHTPVLKQLLLLLHCMMQDIAWPGATHGFCSVQGCMG